MIATSLLGISDCYLLIPRLSDPPLFPTSSPWRVTTIVTSMTSPVYSLHWRSLSCVYELPLRGAATKQEKINYLQFSSRPGRTLLLLLMYNSREIVVPPRGTLWSGLSEWCDERPRTEVSDMCTKWVWLVANGTNPGLFQIIFQYILALCTEI